MRICAGVKLLLLASITFFFSAPVTSSPVPGLTRGARTLESLHFGSRGGGPGV